MVRRLRVWIVCQVAELLNVPFGYLTVFGSRKARLQPSCPFRARMDRRPVRPSCRKLNDAYSVVGVHVCSHCIPHGSRCSCHISEPYRILQMSRFP